MLKSRFSTASIFLSRDSSLERTLLSYFCTSALLSLVSFSSSFLFFKDSSLISKSASFLVVSAVFNASSIISLALSLALPILASFAFWITLPEINHVIGATITNVAIIAIITSTGAPPYLVFIVQAIQHINIILILLYCQEIYACPISFTCNYHILYQ